MNKNVTFFIGNGFDLNLGLKTKYSDIFAKWLESAPSSSNLFLSDYKEHKDIDSLWWNFEASIGSLTSKHDDIHAYLKDAQEAEKYIRNYLHEEQKKFKFRYSDIAKTWKETVNSCIFDDEVNFPRGAEGTINFVNFNHTNTLSVMCQGLKKKKSFKVCTGKDANGDVGYLKLGRCLYVHGSCANQIVMGVDNRGQIANASFLDSKQSEHLVKQSLIEERRKTDLTNLIDNSSLIVLFGVSVGSTDATYWNMLHSWLKAVDGRKIKLYIYDTTHVQASVQPDINNMIDHLIGTDLSLRKQIITAVIHGDKNETEFKFKRTIEHK